MCEKFNTMGQDPAAIPDFSPNCSILFNNLGSADP